MSTLPLLSRSAAQLVACDRACLAKFIRHSLRRITRVCAVTCSQHTRPLCNRLCRLCGARHGRSAARTADWRRCAAARNCYCITMAQPPPSTASGGQQLDDVYHQTHSLLFPPHSSTSSAPFTFTGALPSAPPFPSFIGDICWRETCRTADCPKTHLYMSLPASQQLGALGLMVEQQQPPPLMSMIRRGSLSHHHHMAPLATHHEDSGTESGANTPETMLWTDYGSSSASAFAQQPQQQPQPSTRRASFSAASSAVHRPTTNTGLGATASGS